LLSWKAPKVFPGKWIYIPYFWKKNSVVEKTFGKKSREKGFKNWAVPVLWNK
jgi:hypothetical protein